MIIFLRHKSQGSLSGGACQTPSRWLLSLRALTRVRDLLGWYWQKLQTTVDNHGWRPATQMIINQHTSYFNCWALAKLLFSNLLLILLPPCRILPLLLDLATFEPVCKTQLTSILSHSFIHSFKRYFWELWILGTILGSQGDQTSQS